MSSGIEEYQSVIEDLKPLLAQPNFDVAFKSLVADIPKPKQFLIKMELNRLKKACSRYIDLRGHVDGEIKQYEYDKKIHYMDDIAINVFEEGVRLYGSFSMGVYDAVMNTENNYRVRERKEKEQLKQGKTSEPAPVNNTKNVSTPALSEPEAPHHQYGATRAPFASYAIRSEERMNFSIPVELEFTPSNIVVATTSDLSVSGCKVRTTLDYEVSDNQKLIIHFKGLEQEFALGFKSGVEYQAVGIEIQEKFQYIRMKRTFSEKIESFDQFLRNFINGNKRRYKVNLDNTEQAVIVKGYEQYYLPRVASLPVYIDEIDNKLYPTSILTTENNKFHLSYWKDESQNFVLEQVLSDKRLRALLARPPSERATLLYAFTHTNKGKIFFYSATLEELLESTELMSLFIGFGASKPSWRVFKLQLCTTSSENAFIPLSLPNTVSNEIKKLNKPPSARVNAHIRNTFYIADLLPITEKNALQHYQQYEFDIQQVNLLKRFGHPRQKSYRFIEVVAIEYVNLRKETRFLYKTSVRAEKGENGFQGVSRDFSTKGLQIELSDDIMFDIGDVILVSFPDLQKITRKFRLSRLPYEVVMVNRSKRILNLRIYETSGKHLGRLFFQQLIQNNRSKLTAALEAPKIPGLSDALRNMYARAFMNLPFYIHRNRLRFNINTIGIGAIENSLHQMMAQYNEGEYDFNTYPLARNHAITNIFGRTLKNLKRQDPPQSFELFVHFRFKKKIADQAFISEYQHILAEYDGEKDFIKQVLDENAIFFAYKVYLSRTGRPDMEFIANELKYVSLYAIHRAKALEEELWDVCGVGDVIDISDEVMLRYHSSRNDLLKQKKLKKIYFQSLTFTS